MAYAYSIDIQQEKDLFVWYIVYSRKENGGTSALSHY